MSNKDEDLVREAVDKIPRRSGLVNPGLDLGENVGDGDDVVVRRREDGVSNGRRQLTEEVVHLFLESEQFTIGSATRPKSKEPRICQEIQSSPSIDTRAALGSAAVPPLSCKIDRARTVDPE